MLLKKIISGGQTGADMGALLASKKLGIKTGGIAPKNFMTSKGPKPELGSKFNLKELNLDLNMTQLYIIRSCKNVDNSDGTLAFKSHSSVGTDKTIGYCLKKKWKTVDIYSIKPKTNYKPLLIIDVNKNYENNLIKDWIINNNIKILNICGHRDENMTQLVEEFLINSLS